MGSALPEEQRLSLPPSQGKTLIPLALTWRPTLPLELQEGRRKHFFLVVGGGTWSKRVL